MISWVTYAARGGQRCNAQVSFVRHVHYSSGACLLVNRTAFLAAGGFAAHLYEVTPFPSHK